jgi:NAD(P)-dependent dehydrogenase (short-subunit alcohol dehydrogenase family)
MAERGFGRIVFLSSVSAERGGGVFGGVAYSAAKAAQLGFARALAREVGPNGVTVNSVAAGLIDTDITGGALEGERKTQLVAGIVVLDGAEHAVSGGSVVFIPGDAEPGFWNTADRPLRFFSTSATDSVEDVVYRRWGIGVDVVPGQGWLAASARRPRGIGRPPLWRVAHWCFAAAACPTAARTTRRRLVRCRR